MMKIIQIPALQDNYTYLLICEKTGEVAAIDSPDAQVTKDALRAYFTTPLQVMGAQQAAPLRAIWNTHHHWDHTGGNEGLVGLYLRDEKHKRAWYIQFKKFGAFLRQDSRGEGAELLPEFYL